MRAAHRWALEGEILSSAACADCGDFGGRNQPINVILTELALFAVVP